MGDHIIASPVTSVWQFLLGATTWFKHWSLLQRFSKSLLREPVELLGWGIRPSQGLFLHRTTVQTNIHVQAQLQTMVWILWQPRTLQLSGST